MKPTAIVAVLLTLVAPPPPVAAGTASPAAGTAVPRAVTVARATRIPACSVFVDAAVAGTGAGTRSRPYRSLVTAVARAKPAAVICVAEGVYPVSLAPGDKPLTLAGGFKRGASFRVRDSARYVSRAQGKGGSFLRIVDPAPTGDQLTAVDGFEITGYAQAVVRDHWTMQRFDLTNNFIHHNACTADGVAGAGFYLANVRGAIRGNVIADNTCWRGGAGAVVDGLNAVEVTISRNLVLRNAGTEPVSSHGGGLYLFGRKLTITGNRFEANSVTGWGAGLYVGEEPAEGRVTAARLAWNIYVRNRAGNSGGGFFCDDGATCRSDHELFVGNCGGNVLLDSGGKPTVSRFDHMTNVGARSADCKAPGAGVQIDVADGAADDHAFVNALFHGNAAGADLAPSCGGSCPGASVRIAYSMVQRKHADLGLAVTFGAGILAPANPRFVSPATGDYHLKSRFGHFTPKGMVKDTVSSPALAKGDPASPTPDNPPRAGKRTELGTYGNSREASFVR